MSRWGLCVVALAIAGCRYGLDPDVDPVDAGGGFTCQTDADCGGGWHCSSTCTNPNFTPVCVPDTECDPCPNLASDPNNCGSCGQGCSAGQSCINGSCAE